jgi:photoactive yellow protein
MSDKPSIHPDILEAFLDELPIGAIAVDDEGLIQRFNRYEEQLSGKSRQEVIGENFFSDIAPCTNDIEMGQKFRRGIAEGNLDLDFEFTFPYPYNRVARDVHIRAFSVEAAERHANFLLIKEITSQRQLERTNEEMLSGIQAMLKGEKPATAVADLGLATDGESDDESDSDDQTTTQESVCLFADLSSFRDVAEQVAPEELFEILDDRIRHAVQAVHRYGGQITEIAGDSIQAYFPIVEDLAGRPFYDSLRAARDICNTPDKGETISDSIPFRVGISSGSLVQGRLGREEFSQQATIGQALTDARKLSSLAKSDEVILSAEVADRCSKVIGTTELPRLPVAGLDEAGPIHRLETLDLP